ncbi:hypothetical protein CVT24_007581 [Panaeolus cyanescens]|uniref:F-box domain-containing protein n=1 Tax=Panaeolus cyanescens TaxID=181874 RepID=A0A409VR69_9AGAR|nr:hypothetical protein CVT24_007581 [Panaeolus cyanescens]
MSRLDRFRQKLSQSWDRRRAADGVATAPLFPSRPPIPVHRSLDISNTLSSSSPLHKINHQDLQWTLPLSEDVTYYILQSFLLSDFSSLRALASSCRCLSIICRPLAYRVVIILPTINDNTSHARKFTVLLQHAPEIITFIQDLRIINVWNVVSQYSLPQLRSNVRLCLDEYCTSLIAICNQPFPSLKRCRIDIQTSWEALPPHVTVAFENLLSTPTLQHLAYVSGGIPVSTMRSTFRTVDSLAFSGYRSIMSMSQAPTAYQKEADPKLSLQHLHYIDASTLASVTKDLTDAIDFSSLRSLHVELLHASPIALISESLMNLKELTIQLDVFLPGGLTEKLDLRNLKSLENFQVNVDVSMNSRPFQRRIRVISEIFKGSPPRITRMGMKIKERGFLDFNEFHGAWQALDDLFADGIQDSWPRLKTFDIAYFDCLDEDEVERAQGQEKSPQDIRRALHTLDSLGLLNVEVITDPSLYISLYHSTNDADY